MAIQNRMTTAKRTGEREDRTGECEWFAFGRNRQLWLAALLHILTIPEH